MRRAKIAVGLSGGVDSAVAAFLLKNAGYDVVGVTMRIWDGRPLPAEPTRHSCYGPGEENDIEDARQLAESLKIDFHVVDLADAYNRAVLNPCRIQYLDGLTPNPCVTCNRKMKFGLLLNRLREVGVEFDQFATGHYAICSYDEERTRWQLRKGSDREKDQSYFLYQLGQEQLATTRFPLGYLNKARVREIAAAEGLPVAEKPESQDFVAGGYHTLFDGEERPGPIVDQSGRAVGEHRGIHLYTIGQRRGLGLSHHHRLYVTAIDRGQNAIVVGPVEDLEAQALTATALSWVDPDGLTEPRRAKARIRYRHPESPAKLTPISQDRVLVEFESPQQAVTPGQAVVFYDADVVLGGGVIER